jgi:hypothetical protein
VGVLEKVGRFFVHEPIGMLNVRGRRRNSGGWSGCHPASYRQNALREIVDLLRWQRADAPALWFGEIFTFEVVALGPTGGRADDNRHTLDQRLLPLAFCTLVAALFSTFLWFWLEAASMSGLPLAPAFSGGGWRTVLFQTDFGRSGN